MDETLEMTCPFCPCHEGKILTTWSYPTANAYIPPDVYAQMKCPNGHTWFTLSKYAYPDYYTKIIPSSELKGVVYYETRTV